MSAPGIGEVLTLIARHPIDTLARRWNWKAALLSSLSRALLFLAMNLTAGRRAALAACLTELVFRAATSGFYAALTQALGRAEPAWVATLTAMGLLPLVTHSAELAVHWLRGTPRLGASIAASAVFTAISTAFHIFAMRRGVLIVGDARRSLGADLRRLPGLLVAFIVAVVGGTARTAVRLRRGLGGGRLLRAGVGGS
jgi:hypothetical protein